MKEVPTIMIIINILVDFNIKFFIRYVYLI